MKSMSLTRSANYWIVCETVISVCVGSCYTQTPLTRRRKTWFWNKWRKKTCLACSYSLLSLRPNYSKFFRTSSTPNKKGGIKIKISAWKGWVISLSTLGEDILWEKSYRMPVTKTGLNKWRSRLIHLGLRILLTLAGKFLIWSKHWRILNSIIKFTIICRSKIIYRKPEMT